MPWPKGKLRTQEMIAKRRETVFARSPYHGICTASGCSRPHAAKGLCHVHYQRKRTGIPLDRLFRASPGTLTTEEIHRRTRESSKRSARAWRLEHLEYVRRIARERSVQIRRDPAAYAKHKEQSQRCADRTRLKVFAAYGGLSCSCQHADDS